MMQPLVSVILTCYNYGRFVKDALDSVLAQTYAGPMEIILINDGSTDDSAAVVQPYLVDSRIKYIYQENGGQAQAKNSGILASSGEFVAFLDADDIWDPSKLEKQMKLFQNPATAVVYSDQSNINEKSGVVANANSLRRFRGDVFKHLLLDNFIPFSSCVIRKSALDESGLFDESLPMGIDWDLWLRIGARHPFDYVAEPLLFYRMNHSGQMSKNYKMRHACCDRIYEKIFHQFGDRILPEDARRARLYTYNDRSYFYRKIDPMLSLSYAIRSLQLEPFQWYGWRAAITALLLSITRFPGPR